jgi:hypothetical protein
MDADDRELVRSSYMAVRAVQAVIQAVALKTLGPSSNHAFTIDGKLLGDLGELVACLEFGLTPLPTGTKGADATTPDGDTVELKTTAQGLEVSVPSKGPVPTWFVAVSFDRATGDWEFAYHGTAAPVWVLASNDSGDPRAIALKRLAEVQESLEPDDVLRVADAATKRI